MGIHSDIIHYNQTQAPQDGEICELLASVIDQELPEAIGKLWHAHPVWFLDDNPTVGYSKQKKGIRLMFWSGADFDEDSLNVLGRKFKDASVFYNDPKLVNVEDLKCWLDKSKRIQWDYKNLIKRKGKLEKLK